MQAHCVLEVRHQVHAEPALDAKPYVCHLAQCVCSSLGGTCKDQMAFTVFGKNAVLLGLQDLEYLGDNRMIERHLWRCSCICCAHVCNMWISRVPLAD